MKRLKKFIKIAEKEAMKILSKRKKLLAKNCWCSNRKRNNRTGRI